MTGTSLDGDDALEGVSTVLDAVLAHDPDRTAVVARHGSLSYAELDRAADAVAGALAGHGVRPGDRVAAALPNDLDIVACFHGAMRLGAVWVGINLALAPPEKRQLLAASRPTLLLADPATCRELRELPDGLAALPVDPDDPDGVWGRSLTAAAGAGRPPAPDPRAPAAIAYTSGTTGTPRGIVHSQANLLLPGAALVADRGYGPSLVKGDFLPLTILNMMALTTLLTARAGGRTVLIDRRDAAGVAAGIERHGVTVFNGVPALLHSLAHEAGVRPGQLSGLTEVWSGGADCPAPIREAFADRFGLAVHTTYGLTEAPSVVAIAPLGEPPVPGSSGRPLPHLHVAARDDAGRELGPGEQGELCVSATTSGPFAGRYRPMLGLDHDADDAAADDDAPSDPVRDGVLHTGDIGVVDAAGHVHVHDRKKLVILRGGANVYPAEVERVLHGVAGVRACAVVPVPDERLGQRVGAVLEVGPGGVVDPVAVAEHCGHHLARYKLPERVAVVDELPRNAMGKIVRSRLADLLAAHGAVVPTPARAGHPAGRPTSPPPTAAGLPPTT